MRPTAWYGTGITPDRVDYILDHLGKNSLHEMEVAGITRDEAIEMVERSEDALIIAIGDEPVYIGGTIAAARTRHLFGFGTDKLKRALPAFTRIWQTRRKRLFEDGDVNRMETRIPLTCADAIHWLTKHFGFRVECELPHYGINGERYAQLAYTKDDFQQCA